MTTRASRPTASDEATLRHNAKPSGSPFKTSRAGSTMSCFFLCGVHKECSEGATHRILYANHLSDSAADGRKMRVPANVFGRVPIFNFDPAIS